MQWEIGVDTGGTFTDCVARSRSGEERRAKVLSSSAVRGTVVEASGERMRVRIRIGLGAAEIGTFLAGFTANLSRGAPPARVLHAERLDEDHIAIDLDRSLSDPGIPREPPSPWLVTLTSPWEAPIFAVRLALRRSAGRSLSDCRIRIGTTRGTNALLEGRTTPTALFINEGLGDLLLIGDQRRLDIFARAPSKPAPLERVSVGVRARIDANGRVLEELDLDALRESARLARASGATAAAIAFIHADPRHPEGVAQEARVAEILRSEGLFDWVSPSHRCGASARFEPRARAALVDAALSGPVGSFVGAVVGLSDGAEVFMMTSTAGLVPACAFQPRESLLSGPSGGVAAAAAIAAACGFDRCVTLDMGGTSADVARCDGAIQMRDETTVGGVTIASPSVALESVASGGGSILWFDGRSLRVGPTSAGSNPGPACYGGGGPLTLTDANLLLGRIDPARLSIPVDVEADQRCALVLHAEVSKQSTRPMTPDEMLAGFIAIADESMASALRAVTVRLGIDPASHALVAFGGAGALHACSIAERIGITSVLFPRDAGLLCAKGISRASLGRVVSSTCLVRLDDAVSLLVEKAITRALEEMESLGVPRQQCAVTRCTAMLRLLGHEESVEVDIHRSGTEAARLCDTLHRAFASAYRAVYGYSPPDGAPVELERVRVAAQMTAPQSTSEATPAESGGGESILGPFVFTREDSTAFLPPHWRSSAAPDGTLVFTRIADAPRAEVRGASTEELVAARLTAIASDMGEQLRRTAVSANIKDRLDFSCGLLGPDAFLVVNAPHIPIHLGALGMCVRAVLAERSMAPGDVLVVNHPRLGGSHLPDITAITAIHAESGTLLGYAANRAHHAEIGGSRPGSMPPDAKRLSDEGVVIEPTLVVERGVDRFDRLDACLRSGKWPSRLVNENIMDVRAQVAANELAATRLRQVYAEAPDGAVERCRQWLRNSSVRAAERAIEALVIEGGRFEERLDDGTVLAVAVARTHSPARLRIDFTGSAPKHPGNLNAPLAVTRAAVMYTLRVLVGESLGPEGPAFPLNEGLMDAVDLVIPQGSILAPPFDGPPSDCPACAIGQTETSQRVVDLLWRALGLAACSQGTINNLLFGDSRFGFYETIAGGAGATELGPGENGVHTHISNTRITDAEVLERRYPVRLEEFRVRRGSGGTGAHRGGDGLVRRIRFLEGVDLSFLSQHRVESPYGLAGGSPGQRGAQRIVRADGRIEEVPGIVAARLERGDQFVIESPGGGGFGAPEISTS